MTQDDQRSARTLLAFDAAGRSCSAAVLREGQVLAEKLEAMTRGQAERLVPMIEEVLGEAGVSHGALDALAVTIGPGAFTGVRIGLAAARGYALALGIPQIGVTTFEAVAEATTASEREGQNLLVLLDSKRADLYAQLFDAGLTPLGAPFTAEPSALPGRLEASEALLLAGDGVEQALPALAGFDCRIAEAGALLTASCLARVAARKPLPAAGSPPPAPLYLRPPDVTFPKSQARGGQASVGQAGGGEDSA